MGRRTWWLGVLLGSLLLALAVAETFRVLASGDGGLLFWLGTLGGGGALVLAGTLLADRMPRPALVMTVVGCVAGILPTMWTLVIPLLLLTLAVLRLRPGTAAPAPGTS